MGFEAGKHVPYLGLKALVVTVVSLTSFSTFHMNTKHSTNTLALIFEPIAHNQSEKEVVIQNSKRWIELSLKGWIKKAPTLASLLVPGTIPNRNKPFVFFHIRKGGGSTLRSTIFNATKNNSLQSWIPGITTAGVPFSLPPTLEIYEVYASHVNFIQIVQLFREVGAGMTFAKKQQHLKKVTLDNDKEASVYTGVNDKYPLFDCLTNLRPTVSRVVSCWNYRMIQSKAQAWRIPAAHDLSSNDWETLLPVTYDEYSNGCNNEIARIFGSTVDETVVNTLSPDNPIFLNEFEKIASRMSQCIVTMVHRCDESNTIISHFFPWMTTNLCNEVRNKALTTKDMTVLQANATDAILSQNYMDELLFNLGEALFENQLAIARNSS
eukprot:scaffold19853_cov89-Attheya_sp.AAC.1